MKESTSAGDRARQPEHFERDARVLADETQRSTRRHPLAWGFGLGVVVSIAMLLLILQNTHRSAFEWLWWDFEAAAWVLLLVSFTAGAIAVPALLAGALLLRDRRDRLDVVASGVRQHLDRESDRSPPQQRDRRVGPSTPDRPRFGGS
jgi:uncharacterized integral membrane protein